MGITIKVKLDTPCILWTGATNHNGYGLQYYKGRMESAHRVAYCEHNGLTLDDIDGIIIRHRCDNPPCRNPEHLLAGTHQDNMDDRERRGRQPKGAHSHNAVLTNDQVREIRAKRAVGVKIRVLAAEYGVARSVICKAARGETYRDVV